jgi:hypothetical protein
LNAIDPKGSKVSHKLKAFGAIVGAALVVGAISVASAPATAGGHFIAETAHTTINGSQIGTMQLDDPAGNVTCQIATFDGTVSTVTTESITLTPHYTNCISGTNTAIVDHNGCNFTFTVRPNPETNHNTPHLVCPPGQSVTLTVFFEHTNTLACIIHFGPQTPTGGLLYKTGGSGTTHDITAVATVTGITVTRTPQFFGGCKFAPEHGATDQMTGEATIKGFNTEGKQVGITAT